MAESLPLRGPIFRFKTGKCRRETAVGQVNLGHLDQALGFVSVPRRQTPQQEQSFENAQILIDGLAAHAQVATQGGKIEQPGTTQRDDLEQPAQFSGITYARDIGHIALKDGAQILPMPLARASGRACYRLGIAAAQQSFEQIAGWRRRDSGDARGETPCEKVTKQSAGLAFLFRLA